MRLGDLDELKKYAMPCEIHNGALTELCVPLYQIDNAPTVFDCKSCKNNGNERECIDFHEYSNFVKYEERQQGEWEESHIFSCGNILRMGMDVIEHKCKNCGRWSIKWVRTIPDNFCSNCGAEMVKGGAE